MDIPLKEMARRGRDETGFGHLLTIGQVQLKHMATRFYVHPRRNRIRAFISRIRFTFYTIAVSGGRGPLPETRFLRIPFIMDFPGNAYINLTH